MIQRLFDSPPPEKSALERLGLSKEPSQAAGVLRAILKGVKEGAADELKKLPGGSIALGVVESLLELSGDDSGQQTEQRLEEILDLGKQSKNDLDALKAEVPNAYRVLLGDSCHAYRGMELWLRA